MYRCLTIACLMVLTGCQPNAATTATTAQPITPTASGANLEVYYFTAKWCGPCQTMKPILARVKANNPGVIIQELDIDNPANKSLTQQYNVQSIPLFIVKKEGREVGRKVGAVGESQFSAFLQECWNR